MGALLGTRRTIDARLIDFVLGVKYKMGMDQPGPLPDQTPDPAPDPTAPRVRARESKRLALIERVLDAADALFLEQGYDGTKISDVCGRAGIAYGTFFNHFDEKRDLLRGLSERSLRRMTEKLEGLAKGHATLEAQLAFLFEEGAAQLVPAQREILGHIWSVTVSDASGQSDRRYHAAFESFLAEGVARGMVRADVPLETLAEIVGSTFSNMTLNWVHIEHYPIAERARTAARFLAESLAPRAERA